MFMYAVKKPAVAAAAALGEVGGARRRQEGRGIDRAGRGRRARAGALGAALPVREHAFTRRVRVPIIRSIPASPAPSARRTA